MNNQPKNYISGTVSVRAAVDKRGHTRKPHTRIQQLLAKFERTGHIVSPRFDSALSMATQAHNGQVRKGAKDEHGYPVPYITHPVAVAALVSKYGGSEDQAIAGMLHDVVEDGGPQWSIKILEQFGKPVWDIVMDCTDGTPDESGKKAPWLQRKTDYLAHLSKVPDTSLLVSACDKLHNITAIRNDLDEVGPSVFDRFSSSQEQTLWYYRRLAEIFAARKISPAEEISKEYHKIISRLK
jgi:(p)ppGpp synthase/HD superfamily hydrolase